MSDSSEIGSFAGKILVESLRKQKERNNHHEIVKQMIADKMLSKISAQVLSASDPKHNLISRFAEITQMVAEFSPEGCQEVAPYLPRFIQFIEETDILDLWTCIFGNAPWAQELQKILARMDFVGNITKVTDRLETCDHIGGRTLHCYGIYRMISSCATSPILGPVIRRPEYIAGLLHPITPTIDIVKGARWKAYVDLITDENWRAFVPLLDEAASELGMGPTMPEYKLHIIHILVFISNHSESVSRQMVRMNFVAVLWEVLSKYPNHTIAHKYVRNSLTSTISNTILGPHVWNLIKKMARLVCDRSHELRILKATCLGFFCRLMEMAKTDARIMTIIGNFLTQDDPCWEIIRRSQSIVDAAYGGELEKQ